MKTEQDVVNELRLKVEKLRRAKRREEKLNAEADALMTELEVTYGWDWNEQWEEVFSEQR
jgi:hypothetical protein